MYIHVYLCNLSSDLFNIFSLMLNAKIEGNKQKITSMNG